MCFIFLLALTVLLIPVVSASASLGIQANFPPLHLSPLHDRFQHDGLKIRGDVGWIIGVPADGYGVILHTTNGGENWTRQGSPNTIPNVALYDVRAVDACNAWAVGTGPTGVDFTVLKTKDGGRSWQTQMVGALYHMNGVCAVDKYHAWITRDFGSIYWTSNGGKTWNLQHPDVASGFYLMSVSSRIKKTAWVVGFDDYGKGIILHTTNGGVNWTEQFAPVNVPFDRVSFVGTRS
jgi:photosystem II stability/assembly factor-like uncharacterized protein